LEDRSARFDVNRQEIERVADGGWWQFAGKYRVEHFHTRPADDLLPGCRTGRAQSGPNSVFLSVPTGNDLLDIHL
jgi:hypothetical protein